MRFAYLSPPSERKTKTHFRNVSQKCFIINAHHCKNCNSSSSSARTALKTFTWMRWQTNPFLSYHWLHCKHHKVMINDAISIVFEKTSIVRLKEIETRNSRQLKCYSEMIFFSLCSLSQTGFVRAKFHTAWRKCTNIMAKFVMAFWFLSSSFPWRWMKTLKFK